MTHDSIGLGEDGPTHQPIEHLAMCRATPNMLLFRPADTIEVAESWELAMEKKTTPSVHVAESAKYPDRADETHEEEHDLVWGVCFGKGDCETQGYPNGDWV